MNTRCTICDAVLADRHVRCPECGARGIFQTPTSEPTRDARSLGVGTVQAWEFSPDGPVLTRR